MFVILGHVGHFRPFWAILAILGHFGPFWEILNMLANMTILANMANIEMLKILLNRAQP
jgi:hypothetical protein